MSDRTTALEQRVETLEQQVAELLKRIMAPPVKKDWRSTIGMFANDPVMKEIDEEGRKIREAERERRGVIILDTDHIVVLKYSHGSEYLNLTAKMTASLDQDFVTTVVTLEEQLRGWLALIRRSNDPHRQVSGYARLNDVVDYFGRWIRLPFDDAAADQFVDLRRQKVRIATMDLKIGAIALAHDALLLSANRRDFEQIPGLRVEDWLR